MGGAGESRWVWQGRAAGWGIEHNLSPLSFSILMLRMRLVVTQVKERASLYRLSMTTKQVCPSTVEGGTTC